MADGTACTSDGDPCTDDICVNGVCDNPPVDCDDEDECTSDFCDPDLCGSDCPCVHECIPHQPCSLEILTPDVYVCPGGTGVIEFRVTNSAPCGLIMTTTLSPDAGNLIDILAVNPSSLSRWYGPHQTLPDETLPPFTAEVTIDPASAFGTGTVKVSVENNLGPCSEVCDSGTVTVHVVPPIDLVFLGLPEENEETVGGYICVNDDDDNNNQTFDKDDTGPTAGEDDLVPLIIDVHANLQGTLTLSIETGAELIALYEAENRSTPLTLPVNWQVDGPFTTVVFVEGISVSNVLRDLWFRLAFEGNGEGCDDEVRATVVRVDLDIDTDNTNARQAPDRSDAEDVLENFTGQPPRPGKYIPANWDNDDDPEPFYGVDTVHERIDDLGDGFNAEGENGNDDDQNPNEDDFIPIILELPQPLDLATARLRIYYASSPRASMTIRDDPPYDAPNRRHHSVTGGFRIWTKYGNETRDFASILQGGDYVPAYEENGDVFSASDLGFVGGARVVTLYVEGLTARDDAGSDEILVELDPDGPGPAGFVCYDYVRLTVLRVSFVAINPTNRTGFDHTINPCGLMVPMPGGDVAWTDVVSEGGGWVKLRVTQPGIVQIPTSAHLGDFRLEITSASEGATVVEAYADTTDELALATLRVHTLPQKEARVAFHRVSDIAGHASSLTPTDAQAILFRMNQIWDHQANIRFVPDPPKFESDPPVQQDLGPVVQFYDQPGPPCSQTDQADVRLVWVNELADYGWDIFSCWEYEQDCAPDEDDTDNQAWGASGADYATTDEDMPMDSYAHEGGHYFLLDNPHFLHPYTGNLDADENGDWSIHNNLMEDVGPSALRVHITLRQAILANGSRP